MTCCADWSDVTDTIILYLVMNCSVCPLVPQTVLTVARLGQMQQTNLVINLSFAYIWIYLCSLSENHFNAITFSAMVLFNF